MSLPRKTKSFSRAELSSKVELITRRLNRLELSLFERTFNIIDELGPPPGNEEHTFNERVKILEEKVDLILKHLEIKIKKQPEQFVIIEDEKFEKLKSKS